jgi:dUTP pyrophosphatase
LGGEEAIKDFLKGLGRLPTEVLSGEEVARLIEGEIRPEQVQPAGVDLTVRAIYTFGEGVYRLSDPMPSEEYREAPFTRAEDHKLYTLKAGPYLIEFGEVVAIPTTAIGILLPRSSLLRHGIDVKGALFDPGYRGRPRALMVCHRPVQLPAGMRVGQLTVIRGGKGFKAYRGQYQGEV